MIPAPHHKRDPVYRAVSLRATGIAVCIGAFFSAANKNGDEFSPRLANKLREGASPHGRDASLAARRPRPKLGE